MRAPRRVSCRLAAGLFAALTLASIMQATRAHADAPAVADPADAIVGDWLVDSRDAVVHVERVGSEYQGSLAWLKQSTYGPEDGPELNGKPVTDSENPDESLRARPLLGLRLLWGLHYAADKHSWEDGRVYNTDNGQTYHCRVWVDGAGRLKLRGYVGFALLGGTTTWTRTQVPPQAVEEPPARSK